MRCSTVAILGALLTLYGCAGAVASDHSAPFVDASEIVADLKVEMRYFGDQNFIGEPINGYETPVCLLTPEAATALSAAQADLSVTGLGLKVFDCYRPQRAVGHFVRWARDLSDTRNKAVYYPEVPKAELFERGYIAEKSGHSRGSTLDLTIVDIATGAELDMGSGYDLFDPLSWPGDPRPTSQQRANRALLRSVMLKNGFKPLTEEWWHFTLVDEPYPDTYFDVPVE